MSYLDCIAEERVLSEEESIVICYGITLNGCPDPKVIHEGSMTASRYINEIIEQPFISNLGSDFILQQDNPCPHNATHHFDSAKCRQCIYCRPMKNPSISKN